MTAVLTDTDRRLIDGLRGGECTGPGPCDTAPIGEGDNWVTKVDGLPLYIRAIAHALIRSGHGESEAVALAVGTVKRWAAGGGNVKADTRGRAAAAVAEWEAKKAASHGSRDAGPVTEASSAGTLLPVGPTPKTAAAVEAHSLHAFRGRDLQSCVRCGQPAAAPIHQTKTTRRSGSRAGGAYSAGHQFWGNQYSAAQSSGATPAQLDQLAKAITAVAGGGIHITGGGGQGGKSSTGGGKGGKGKAAGKKAASAAKKAAAAKQTAANRKARTVASLKKAVTTAQTNAARDRALAAQAKTASAKARYTARGQAYEKAAVNLENALVSVQGHRAGPEPDDGAGRPVGSPVRERMAHKRTFAADSLRLETGLHDTVTGLFARQEKRTLSSLRGGRGRKLRSAVRAAQQPPDNNQPAGGPPPDAGAIFPVGDWTEATVAAVTPLFDQAATTAAGHVDHQLALPAEVRGSLDTVRQALTGRANRLAGQVTDTTYQQIQQALADGVAAGDSTAQLAGRVQHVFQTARSRAELIARTEAIGALNEAAFTYASTLPAGAVGRKEWLAVHDQRTRVTHRLADGQQVALHMPFVVGGTLMQHPGDRSAPPDEVCNCRCNVLYLPGPATSLPALSPQIGEAA